MWLVVIFSIIARRRRKGIFDWLEGMIVECTHPALTPGWPRYFGSIPSCKPCLKLGPQSGLKPVLRAHPTPRYAIDLTTNLAIFCRSHPQNFRPS